MEHDSFPNCDKDIIEACSFKGAVDPRLRSAMESGSIVEDTRAMATRDVMHQWSSRTRDAKTKAVETFRAYLRATNRDNIFFPANGQQTSSKENEEGVLCEFGVMRVMAGNSIDAVLGMISHVRTWCYATMNRTFGNRGNLTQRSYTSQVLKGMRGYVIKDIKMETKRSALSWDEIMIIKGDEPDSNRSNQIVAVAVAFAGLFRMGELTSTSKATFDPVRDLCERNVHFAPSFWTATQVTIRIGASKADQSGIQDRDRPKILPVGAGLPGGWLRDLLARRHGLGVGQEPTLRASPLFQNERGAHLAQDVVLRYIRSNLKRSGYSAEQVSTYGTHSARIGGATKLHQMGVSSEVIKAMGGWSSDAWKTYIRIRRQELLQISKTMCL